jgi:hypothetical protein
MKSYVVALAVVVGILGGFYGGYEFGKSNASASTNGTRSLTATGGGSTSARGGGGATRFASACPTPGATPSPGGTAVAFGTITNLSSTSMTIQTPQCDITITFGSNVTITKQAIGSTSDLQDNLTVSVSGSRQADGSIQASQIAINPGGPGGGFRRGGSGSGSGGGG